MFVVAPPPKKGEMGVFTVGENKRITAQEPAGTCRATSDSFGPVSIVGSSLTYLNLGATMVCEIRKINECHNVHVTLGI